MSPIGGRLNVCVVCMIALAAVAAVNGCKKEISFQHTSEQLTSHRLARLRDFIQSQLEESSQPYPEGGLSDLEAWLNEQWQDERTRVMMRPLLIELAAAVVRVSQDGRLHLVDIWGHPLVYRCPSNSPGHLFRLYSIGPNGVDEDGAGDDIDGAPASGAASSS